MKLKFDVSLDEYKIINAILNEHLAPRCLVFVFGSRAKNTARFNSDLDLAIDSDKPLTQKEMVMLKDAFNESRLPYTVDVVDMHNIEKSFRDIIDSQKVRFPLSPSLSRSLSPSLSRSLSPSLSRSLSGVEGKGNVPQLRFPKFSGEWVEKRLGEVANLTSSKRVYLSDYVKNGIPFYRGKEISELKKNIIPADILYITESAYLEFKSKYGAPTKNDVLITAVGTLGNIYRVKDNTPFYFKDGNLIWLREIKEDSTFLEILLEVNKKDIDSSSIGSTQRALTIVGLNKLKFLYPSLPEQQKIADFLTEVDNKTQSLTQKKEALSRYKKGLLQKLFPPSKKGGFDTSTGSVSGAQPPSSPSLSDCDGTRQPRSLSRSLSGVEGKGNVPELRFPEFSGEWVEKKLGEVADVRDGTHDSPKFQQDGFPLITSKNLLKNGLIDFDNVSYISEQEFKQINKRSKVDIGDILFGMIGTIGNPVQLKQDGFAIKNVALIKEHKKLLNQFLIYYLHSNNIQKQFFIKNIGGTQKFLPLGVIRNLKIIFASLPEQQKIADFLTTVDNKITQVDQQIEKMNQFKKGLLQQMFPASTLRQAQCPELSHQQANPERSRRESE